MRIKERKKNGGRKLLLSAKEINTPSSTKMMRKPPSNATERSIRNYCSGSSLLHHPLWPYNKGLKSFVLNPHFFTFQQVARSLDSS